MPTIEGEREELLATFLSRWPASAPESPPDALADRLMTVCADAEAAFPAIGVPRPVFAAYLAERLDPQLDPVTALGRAHVDDLYLACGCGRGDPAAIAHLERTCLPRLRLSVRQIDPSEAFVADVLQRLRTNMLVGNISEGASAVPRIGQYRGRGAIQGWLDVAVVRLALSRRHDREQPAPADDLELIASPLTPELEQLRARWGADVGGAIKAGVRSALQTLTAEDRNLVRLHLVGEVSLRALARTRGVNVSTISREYARIRQSILEHVRDTVTAQTGLPAKDFDTVVGELMSRITISLGALLRTS